VMLPLNADTARQLGLPDDRGALIDAVFANSPAALAGLRRGDFVVKFDGREVGGYRDLRKRVSEAAVGRETEMEILREGERIKVPVTIVEQAQSNAAVAAPAPALIAPSSVQAGALSGVTVRGLTPQLSAKIGLPDSVEGVLVQSVADGSPAAGVLLPGDVIELVNDTPVTQPEQFAAVAGALAPGERAIVLLSRGRVRAFEVVGP
ncbi:MAG: PDZ domain-containing protein, partial [Chthoniobacterales bacterium]